jgi:hypothetical protein
LRVNPPKIQKEIHFDGNNKCVFGQVRDPPKSNGKNSGEYPGGQIFSNKKIIRKEEKRRG